MATAEERLRLRRMTGEEGDSKYTDADLDGYILDAGGVLQAAAAVIWGEKASAYADLVNISEAGSSRSYSDLFEHAKIQQAHFDEISGGGASASSTTTTRRIVRA